MKLEVGMYARTKREIFKFLGVDERGVYRRTLSSNNETVTTGFKIEDVLKASHNIIDLIEVGDYVNGLEVYETGIFGHNGKTFCRIYGNVAPFYNEDIKSIVTKEQFKDSEYVVE